MEYTREISIKRPSGTWGGIVDSSSMTPGPGTFETLTNCYLNRDGTEIRRWLGSKKVGEPFLGDPRLITDITSGATPTITFGRAHYAKSASTFEVYILDNSELADGYYTATWATENTITVAGTSTGTTAGGYVFFPRARAPHVLTHADGRPVIVAETVSYKPDAGVTEAYHIASWVGSKTLDPADPETPNYSSQTGSGDEATDTGFIFWRSPHMWVPGNINTTPPGTTAGLNEGDAQHFTTETLLWEGMIFSMDIRGRISADVLNNRVLLAVPGYGCMFEVNVQRARLGWQADDLLGDGSPNIFDHRRTKALGIPRGLMGNSITTATNWWDTTKEPAHSVDDQEEAQRGFESAADYVIACGYYDPFTGEAGLASQPVQAESTTSGAERHLHLDVVTPRGVLRECTGLLPVIYISSADGSLGGLLPVRSFFYDFENYGGSPGDHDVDNLVYEADRIDRVLQNVGAGVNLPKTWRGITYSRGNADETTAPNRFPILEQMPVGAAWVRVVRGRMFSGGTGFGKDDVKVLAYREWITGTPIGASASTRQHYLGFVLAGATIDKTRPSGSLCDAYTVPPSYEGHYVSAAYQEQDLLSTAKGVPDATDSRPWFFQARLIQAWNEFTAGPNADTLGQKWFLIDEKPFYRGEEPPVQATSAVAEAVLDQEFRILLQPDLIQYSEEGFPGVVSSNRLPIDSLQGRRPTGMARLGDEAIVFTDRSAHLFQFGLLPRRATSQILSNRYGCVAPSSVIEADGMVAWISAEGPVAFSAGQGIRWISRHIQDLWQTFVSASDGSQGEIQGVHDTGRGLFLWQVRTSYSGEADNTSRPKGRCDQYLIWNYAADAWSLVDCPEEDRPFAIEYMPIHDTTDVKSWWAPCFVGRGDATFNYPVFMLDEDYSARRAEPVNASITSDWDGTTTITASGLAASQVFNEDEGFIYSQVGQKLRWTGTFSAENSAGSATATSVSGITGWKTGDTLQGGVISMSMTTNLMRMGDLGTANIIHGVTLRLVEYQDPDASYTAISFARVRLEDEDGVVTNLCRNALGDKVTDGTNRFKTGQLRCEQFKLHINIYSNVQVRLKDVAVEVDAST